MRLQNYMNHSGATRAFAEKRSWSKSFPFPWNPTATCPAFVGENDTSDGWDLVPAPPGKTATFLSVTVLHLPSPGRIVGVYVVYLVIYDSG